MRNTSIQGVLIDLDGTLVDSETLKAQALSLASAHFGRATPAEAYAQVMGRDWDTVRQRFLSEGPHSPSPSDFDSIFKQHYLALIDSTLAERPFTREFLKELRREGVRVALVSSAKKWMLDRVLDKLSLRDAFDLVITGDDVSKHKPDPEAYLLALQKLGIDAEEALVLEDSEAGIEAGLAAGCRVIGIRHTFNRGHDFSGAIFERDSFENVISAINEIMNLAPAFASETH